MARLLDHSKSVFQYRLTDRAIKPERVHQSITLKKRAVTQGILTSTQLIRVMCIEMKPPPSTVYTVNPPPVLLLCSFESIYKRFYSKTHIHRNLYDCNVRLLTNGLKTCPCLMKQTEGVFSVRTGSLPPQESFRGMKNSCFVVLQTEETTTLYSSL